MIGSRRGSRIIDPHRDRPSDLDGVGLDGMRLTTMQGTARRYHLDRMGHQDIDEVARIERRSFTSPWPMAAYRRELRRTEQNTYLVLRTDPDSHPGEEERGGVRAHLPFGSLLRRDSAGATHRIAGFAGMWQLYDEAHVTTIAVDPRLRGRGFGEALFVALLAEATKRGTTWLSLEVRVSNRIAQRLYEKYELSTYSRRPGYYTNDGEDALVMWSRSLRDPAYVERLNTLRDQLQRKIGDAVDIPRLHDVGWQRRPPEPGGIGAG